MIGKKFSKIFLTGLVFLALLFLWAPQSAFAQGPVEIDDEGGFTACEDLSDPACTEAPTLRIAEIWIIKGIYIAWAVGGLIFLIGLMSIGFRWLTSGGEQQKLEELKKQATYWAISIPIFFGGVPVINFMLQIFPINEEAVCLQELDLPAFQIVFPESCQPGAIDADVDGKGGCCANASGCFDGETCNVQNGACYSGKSCLPMTVYTPNLSNIDCDSANDGQTIYTDLPSGVSCFRCDGFSWKGC